MSNDLDEGLSRILGLTVLAQIVIGGSARYTSVKVILQQEVDRVDAGNFEAVDTLAFVILAKELFDFRDGKTV